ncbi:MAG TPA: GerMN domain-containing protein [Terriglobia bacterium]|nr:GerMN domain-containing protein [Terriglobia bacterium]HVB28569.1 GerMN domain-containing protein [Terriglobia bacterium]
MSRRALILSVAVAIVLGVGTYYLMSLRRHMAPSHASTLRSEQKARTQLNEAALQAGGQAQTLTLYFPSYADGNLVAETRSVKLSSDNVKAIRQILLALIEGSHQGHGSALSPSTTIRAVFLTSDGTAIVDLSQEALADFQPGIESESLAIYSIVDSVCANLPAAKEVKFLVQGQEAQTLDGHIDLTGSFAPEPSLIAQTH